MKIGNDGVILRVALAAGAMLAAGCDFEFPWQRREREAAQQAVATQRAREETERIQAKSECASLKQYVEVQARLLMDRQGELDRELDELRRDRMEMSSRMRLLSEKSLEDAGGTRAKALYELLKDSKLNELAFKHLGNDFAVQNREFAEKVREAQAAERSVKSELEGNARQFQDTMDAEQEKVEARKEAASQAAIDIRAEISRLERQSASLRKRINSERQSMRRLDGLSKGENITARNRQLQTELSRVESRLNDLQTRYNSVRLSQESSEQVRRAENEKKSVRAAALHEQQTKDRLVRQRAQGMVTASKIAEEYEALTIRRLDKFLQEKDLAMRDRKKELAEQISYLTHATVGVDALDLAGVRRLRTSIESKLKR